MRINDWSSNVCSSDLEFKRQGRQGGTRTRFVSNARPGTAGATRTCPHCKTTILESSSVCPSCRHYLRFDSPAAQPSKTITPLNVEGKIRHPSEGGAWESSSSAERRVGKECACNCRYRWAPVH